MSSDGDDAPPPPEPADARPGNDELPLAKDAFSYIADRRILAAANRRTSEKLARHHVLPAYYREIKTHLDPDEWRTGFLAVHDYFIPAQLTIDLRQNVPQALLRDLYRPVHESFVWYEREVHVTLDRAGSAALAAARAARKLEPRPVIEPSVRDVAAEQARRREFVSTRWKPLYADDAPHPSVRVFRND